MASCRIFVGNLTDSMTSEDLRSAFSDYGEVMDAFVMKGKGFGFVTFKDASVAATLVDTTVELDGVKLRIGPAGPSSSKKERQFDSGGFGGGGGGGSNNFMNNQQSRGGAGAPVSNRIFVSRLPEDMKWETLKAGFRRFGVCQNVFIPKPFKGYGFVTFANPRDAAKLVDMDIEVDGHMLRVGPAPPRLSKEEYEASKQQQQHQQQPQQMGQNMMQQKMSQMQNMQMPRNTFTNPPTGYGMGVPPAPVTSMAPPQIPGPSAGGVMPGLQNMGGATNSDTTAIAYHVAALLKGLMKGENVQGGGDVVAAAGLDLPGLAPATTADSGAYGAGAMGRQSQHTFTSQQQQQYGFYADDNNGPNYGYGQGSHY